ncbi:MAG: hypothetical protein K2M48_03360 [Clostridiales bacterium]|nr:hypothetical protein [Clostridiales bacterium]
MYGYIVPNKPTLRASDFVLYRSFYCGICCQTGKLYGQLPRFTPNYDFAFLSALLHDYSRADLVIEEHKCVLNPIKKKATVMPNSLLGRLAAANIMLAYQKADDGVIDGDGVKYRVVRRVLKKSFTAAKKAYGDIWERIRVAYDCQREVEKSGITSVDRAADPFASLMRDLPELILGVKTDDNLKSLCYNIGKFVYIADALDDVADDVKKKRYNPLSAAYALNKQSFKGRKAFIAEHREELGFYLGSCCGRAAEAMNGLRFTQSYSLIRNIVCDGMSAKTEELLKSEKKLPPPRI